MARNGACRRVPRVVGVAHLGGLQPRRGGVARCAGQCRRTVGCLGALPWRNCSWPAFFALDAHGRWTGLQDRASVSVIQDESAQKKPGQSAGLFHSLEVLLNHPLAGRRAFLARDHDNVGSRHHVGHVDSAGLRCTFSHQGTHVGKDLNGVDALGRQIHHACS